MNKEREKRKKEICTCSTTVGHRKALLSTPCELLNVVVFVVVVVVVVAVVDEEVELVFASFVVLLSLDDFDRVPVAETTLPVVFQQNRYVFLKYIR